jgi:threonine/homoserine/homoserine lactone efflux protein
MSLLNKKKSSFRDLNNEQLPSDRKIFIQGLLTNVLNPKVALFFLAFIPQFIEVKNAHPQRQIVFLGIWFNCSGTIVNILVAILFGRMGRRLSKSEKFQRIQQKITGCLLIALGIKVAAAGHRN